MRRKFSFGRQWFFEDVDKLGEPVSSVWGLLPGKDVYKGRSRFQKIEIFDSEEFGRILALDGLIQLPTKHEFVYHEMLVHPAYFYAYNPKKALIIGGGDGGALRELVKHPLDEILLIDIDSKVIEASKKYLPTLSSGAFNDKRVAVQYEDALSWIKTRKSYYHIIINNCTDPYGPSEALWSREFYKLVLEALSKNGVASFQTGYFKEKFARKGRADIKRAFPFSKVHRAFVGCFPFDECTFTFASKSVDFAKVSLPTIERRYKGGNIRTRYYSPQIHFASGVIPRSHDENEQ